DVHGAVPWLISVHISFFFSISRRPPRPPLCPYTTLFRSPRSRIAGTHMGKRGRDGTLRRSDAGRGAIGDRLGRQYPFSTRLPRLDRKSTRLNSSHVKISYAVFCLKKKKID